MKRNTLFSVLTSLLLLLNVTHINADKKQFTRSYTAYTLPANALELELWQTGRIGKGSGYYYRWQPRFEIEYGITDRFTSAIYFNFNEVKTAENTIASKPLSLSTTSFEFRYRLSNPDELPIDPALYFEFGYGGDKIFYEPKILLSKRFDKFTAVLNLVSEIERYPTKNEIESKFEILAGVAYELNKNFGIAVEFRNNRNYSSIYEKEKNQASFIGPTISFHTERLYLTTGFLFQITGSPATQNNLDLEGHEKYEFRTILGVEL
jgi:hypothetical protein